jgi:hypothetical protein
MLYREVNYNERKPIYQYKEYFFMGWCKEVKLIQSSGYVSNMEEYYNKCDKLVWLEPEADLDPDAYQGNLGIDAVEELNKILEEEIKKNS